MNVEESVNKRIHNEISFMLDNARTNNNKDLWSSRAAQFLRKYVGDDNKVKYEVIENFRNNQVFINEFPSHNRSILDYVLGGRRGQQRYLKERYKVMDNEGDLEWLEKYPILDIGNPYTVSINGYIFNKRWSNNLRYLSLINKHLDKKLCSNSFVTMDIGGGYGIFLYLLKNEYPKMKHILVEFPEQLILSFYFLINCFPDANINTLEEVYAAKVIDRTFINKYDFCLVPIDCFSKINDNSIDLLANFFSLGEMSEEWFGKYRNSSLFNSTKYFFTVNRFFSKPTYGTDIDILNYKLDDYKKLYFGVSPYEQYYYDSKWIFFEKKIPYTSQFFEFIGKKII